MATIEQIWIFHCGYMAVPRGLLIKGGGMERKRLPFLAALALHSERGPILIDAPFGHEGPANNGEVVSTILRTFGLTFEPDWAVIPRIKQLGFRPSEVEDVLMTHLHWDHTGGMKSFAHANFHINPIEWDFATGLSSMDAARGGYVQGDFRALRSRLQYLDVSQASLETEGYDVFGDGSIFAVSLPGHSIGHTGFRMKVGDSEVLYAGDSAFSIGQITRDESLGIFPRAVSHALPQARETLASLRRYHRRNPDVQLVTSHDFDLGEICMQGPHQFA